MNTPQKHMRKTTPREVWYPTAVVIARGSVLRVVCFRSNSWLDVPPKSAWRDSEYRTRTRLYIGREAMTGGTAAHTIVPHAVDNPQRGLVSYGRYHRAWHNASYDSGGAIS